MEKTDVLIVGGGPAGMMSAIAAREAGAAVTLVERNATLGRKLLLTGKGRCNLTTAKTKREIIAAFSETGNGRFLWDALNQFSPEALKAFFEARGLALKTERGGRVFPVTDRAESVLEVLKKELKKTSVRLLTGSHIQSIQKNGGFHAETSLGTFEARAVIITTGGVSYPQTGSTGDGFRFATALGHTVARPRPALVPFASNDLRIKDLQGVGLKNVEFRLYLGEQLITRQFGELLFTHFGLSGPIVLEASRFLPRELGGKQLTASIDLKPKLNPTQLDERLQREIETDPHIIYKTLLKRLLPLKMIPLAEKETGIDPAKKIAQLTKLERQTLAHFLKELVFPLVGPRPADEAIITAGGVVLDEINPKTLESKIVPGLFFAGEVLDLDGPSGGFNLTMCFATGHAAGCGAAQFCLANSAT